MVLGDFDIVDSWRIDVCKSRRYVLPLLRRSLLCASILSRAILTLLIKYRLCGIKFNQFELMYLFLLFFLSFEYFSAETTVNIVDHRPFNFSIKLSEVILKFLLEHSLRKWERNLSVLTILLVHLPRRLQSCTIVLKKHMIRIDHEVVEVVGCTHHRGGDVIIIFVRFA